MSGTVADIFTGSNRPAREAFRPHLSVSQQATVSFQWLPVGPVTLVAGFSCAWPLISGYM